MCTYSCKEMLTAIFVLVVAARFVTGELNCTHRSSKVHDSNHTGFSPVLEKDSVVMVMFLGFGGLSLLLAAAHTIVRRYIYRDASNFDTTFDAGGNVSIWLTAVTVASQMMWPVDYVQGATFIMKSGLAAVFQVTSIAITVVIFPTLTISLKTKAPGAKTFLQIVYARFGKPAHIMFICVAIFTNVYIFTELIVTNKVAFDVLVKDVPDEMLAMILAVLCGSYCCIGGLGATFYVSYFNLVVTFSAVLVLVVKVNKLGEDDHSVFSMKSRYEAMACVDGPPNNYQASMLTFRSVEAGVLSFTILISCMGINMFDQAFWQSRIATSPQKGVFGYLLAVVIWFSLTPVVSNATATSYISLSYWNGTYSLSDLDIDSGFIPPLIFDKILGRTGGYLMLTMVVMSTMSTGSGEIMAISSIIVYDIYKTYIRPFRKDIHGTMCQLCGKQRLIQTMTQGQDGSSNCICTPAIDCADCENDIELQTRSSSRHGIIYSCPVHGQYRHYEDMLLHYRTWCIVAVGVGVIPLCLIVLRLSLSLFWLLMSCSLVFVPFIVPMYLTIAWAPLTSTAVIAGSLIGLAADVAVVLIISATYYGDSDFGNFFVSTTMEYSVLGGLVSGLIVSGVVSVVITLACPNGQSTDPDQEWSKTLAIDNPLLPWKRIYKQQLEKLPPNVFLTPRMITEKLGGHNWVTGISICVVVVFLGVAFPAVLLSVEILSYENFNVFMKFFEIWCMILAGFVILGPPIEEIYNIWNHLKNTKQDRFHGNDNGANELVTEEMLTTNCT